MSQRANNPNSTASRRVFLARWGGCVVPWLLFLVALVSAPAGASAAEVSKEYQVKAVFLFRLAQFVEWPTNAFASETDPITIGVLGEDPFSGAVDLAVRGETAQGRPIEVVRYRRVDEIKSCHILFVSRSEAAAAAELLRKLSGRAILTVSDIDDFALKLGGMIQFYTDQNKVSMRINPERAKAEDLVLNSRLLRIAEIVKR